MLTLEQRGIPFVVLDIEAQKTAHPDILEAEFWEIIPKIWDYTELSVAVLYNLYTTTKYVIREGVAGDLELAREICTAGISGISA